MLIKDRVYGEAFFEDPVIVDLLTTKPLLRLKNIAQFGLPDKYYHIDGYSRFDHSVGVMILLKKLGATLEEQVAGLLHDISHTAFSHTVDWVVGSAKDENFQDDRHSKFADDAELSGVLKSNGLDPQRIFNFGNFGLLDSEIPNLCADRVDYALREFSKEDTKYCIKNLKVVDGKIVFGDKKSSLLFANNFLSLQMNHWGSFEAVSRWHIFAHILKRALDLKTINFDDFYKDDDFVIGKLEVSADNQILKGLSLLSKRTLSDLPKSIEKQYKKFRYVDPEFVSEDGLKRLSEEDKDFVERLGEARRLNKDGVFLPKLDFPL